MIVLQGSSSAVAIDGATMAEFSGLYAIAENGEVCEPSAIAISDGSGGAVGASPFMVFTIDGNLNNVVCTSIALVPGYYYNITGNVLPVGSTVYLGRGALALDELTSEAVAGIVNGYARKTRSDKTDGYFQFNDVLATENSVTLLALVPVTADMLSLTGFGIAADATVGETPDTAPDSGIQTVILDPYDIPIEDGTHGGILEEMWDFVFDGTAPAGATVYLSLGEFSREADLVDLLRKSTTAASDGSWQIKLEKSLRLTHTAWIYADDATGFSGAITEVKWHVCLSGDTLITMADGTPRRLDALKVGELVRAGDGTPTAITRLERGHFAPHHRLYHFSDGTTIDETGMHRFFNAEQGFFQWLEDWEIGEHALREDGTEAALEEVTTIRERAEQFGIWTESHDYWANGLLSGETAANQRLIATATAEQTAAMAVSLAESSERALLGLEDFYP